MKLILGKNSTTITTTIFIQDSTAVDGSGKTGLINTSINAYYYKNGSTTYEIINLAPMTTGTWVSGGFSEVNSTHMPGIYSLGIPNSVLQDDSANNQDNSVVIMITDAGANNVVPCLLEIQLTDNSLDDFTTIFDIVDSNIVQINGNNTALANEMDANVTEINGDTQSVTDLKDLVDTGYNPVTHKIQGVVLTDAVTSIDATALVSIADAILKRDFSAVSGEANRSALNALRKLMNKVALAGGVLTIYKEDDIASAFTQAVTTDVSAEPVVSVDTV
jgi:hypothetical protein